MSRVATSPDFRHVLTANGQRCEALTKSLALA